MQFLAYKAGASVGNHSYWKAVSDKVLGSG